MDEQRAAADSNDLQLILQLIQQLQVDGIEPEELSYMAIEAYEEYTRKEQLVSINHAVRWLNMLFKAFPRKVHPFQIVLATLL